MSINKTTAPMTLDAYDLDRLGAHLRAITAAVEWLDEHCTDIPLIPIITPLGRRCDITFMVGSYVDGEDAQKAVTAQIVRLIGGHWNKRDNIDTLILTRVTDDDQILRFEIWVPRNAVCEQVVVGTREVTIPAQRAVPGQPERVQVEDVIEWRCGSILDDATEVTA